MFPFQKPLEAPKNFWFSGVFAVHKKGTLFRNGLNWKATFDGKFSCGIKKNFEWKNPSHTVHTCWAEILPKLKRKSKLSVIFVAH